MADEKPKKEPEAKKPVGDDYEILPHKELHDLRTQLNQLKQQPTEKTLQVNMVELASKLDRLMDIFKEAEEMIRVEEGALTFQEKMKPLMDRMDKVLEQNSQIAEGIVGLHDLIMDMRDEITTGASVKGEPEHDFLEPLEGPVEKEAPKEIPSAAPPAPPGPPPMPPGPAPGATPPPPPAFR